MRHQQNGVSVSGSNDNGVATLILIGALGAIILVWLLSKFLGADFGITLQAIIASIPGLLIGALLLFWGRLDVGPWSFGQLALLWPAWWKVLDSIANNGSGLQSEFLSQTAWWTSGFFKWGVELGLIGIATWLFFRSRDWRY